MITLRKLRKLARLSPVMITRHIDGTVEDYNNILKENPKKFELIADYQHPTSYTAYIGFEFDGHKYAKYIGLNFIME